jgi:hypothetical protein
MDFLTVIVLALLGIFVVGPANVIASWLLAKRGNTTAGKIDSDKQYRLALVLCIPIGVILYLVLSSIGLWPE